MRNTILGFVDHFSVGTPWAFGSCGTISTTDVFRVDDFNNESCGGVHGNELRNAPYEASARMMLQDVLVCPGGNGGAGAKSYLQDQ